MSGDIVFGKRLKKLRKQKSMTIAELAASANTAPSTISKVENGLISPTYDVITKLAKGLNASLGSIVSEQEEISGDEENTPVLGRMTVSREASGDLIETPEYDYHYLCSDLRKKKMVPIIAHIKAHSLEEFGELYRHDGEEYLYVLEGEIEVFTEFYRSVTLKKGDSVYLDSNMGHGYISTSKKDALVISVCTNSRFENEFD